METVGDANACKAGNFVIGSVSLYIHRHLIYMLSFS